MKTTFFIFRQPEGRRVQRNKNLSYGARTKNVPATQKRGARQDARSRQNISTLFFQAA